MNDLNNLMTQDTTFSSTDTNYVRTYFLMLTLVKWNVAYKDRLSLRGDTVLRNRA